MPPQRGGRRQKGQGRSRRGNGDSGFAKRNNYVKSSHTGRRLGGNLHGTAPSENDKPAYGSASMRFAERQEWKRNKRAEGNEFDASYGFKNFKTAGERRLGWLLNMLPTCVQLPAEGADGPERAALDLYFLQQDGGTFKATMQYRPYFYVTCRAALAKELQSVLERVFDGPLFRVDAVQKEDLDMANHLSGRRRLYLKLSFLNVDDLMSVRRVLLPAVEKNRRKSKAALAYALGRNNGADDDTLPANYLDAARHRFSAVASSS